MDAAWREVPGPLVPVRVVLEGTDRFIESDAFTLPLALVTPLGTLDYPPRPRATTRHGAELESGVVVRSADRVATLLLRKPDLAVIAILAGWPPPSGLPHGQTADAISVMLREQYGAT